MLKPYSDNHPWLYRNLSITIKANKWTVFVASKEDLRSVTLTCGGLRKLIRPTRAGRPRKLTDINVRDIFLI